ncbi:MAG TPA: hypothetical protein VIO13_01315 [Candidatus Dormibacteraeota bacterium]
MNATSTGLDGTEPRSHTLAFRINSSQRTSIDALARAVGVSASEYARRAVLATRVDISDALDAATQQGRDELAAQVTALQDELTVARGRVLELQQRVQGLQQPQAGPTDRLLAAVRRLLVGSPGAKESVARCWSPFGYHTRAALIPIVAAAAIDEIDRAFARLPITEEGVDAAVDVVERLRWLNDALVEVSGRRRSLIQRGHSPSEDALEAAYADARKQVCNRIDALRKRAARGSTPTAVAASDSEERR